MNKLTSQQRKLAYLAGIVLLSIPIVVLGTPTTNEEGSGGFLAQMRRTHDLGESTLGQVDPTSVTMNLVLLGLRGVATNLLWMEHEQQKNTKNWAQMRATTQSIIMLQPHYLKVWRFHGWNLAYNVSAEWDGVADRFYWVKEGTKFTMEGCRRNRRYPELYWDVGGLTGKKIGNSDEWKYFRRFFKVDPDTERYQGGPDTDINPEGKDNYLVAKDWYKRANAAEDKYEQHQEARILFRSNPAHSQFDYANALNREGLFDEVARREWEIGFINWTQDFGKMRFQAPDCTIFLEADEKDIQELAKENHVDEKVIRTWLNRNQDMVNYRYWRTRSLSESEPESVATHRALYNGEQFFKAGQLDKAQVELEDGMKKMETLLSHYQSLAREDLIIEEALWAVLLWQKILQLKGLEIPEKFPLQKLWKDNYGRVPELEQNFNRRYGGM